MSRSFRNPLYSYCGTTLKYLKHRTTRELRSELRLKCRSAVTAANALALEDDLQIIIDHPRDNTRGRNGSRDYFWDVRYRSTPEKVTPRGHLFPMHRYMWRWSEKTYEEAEAHWERDQIRDPHWRTRSARK